ncbi:MAG: hypothetical protein QHJ82_12070, partial [Verrucomicrobiota bacterium]|nr:hypothetical protein [Verrucomicrobiota bacterium]
MQARQFGWQQSCFPPTYPADRDGAGLSISVIAVAADVSPRDFRTATSFPPTYVVGYDEKFGDCGRGRQSAESFSSATSFPPTYVVGYDERFGDCGRGRQSAESFNSA